MGIPAMAVQMLFVRRSLALADQSKRGILRKSHKRKSHGVKSGKRKAHGRSAHMAIFRRNASSKVALIFAPDSYFLTNFQKCEVVSETPFISGNQECCIVIIKISILQTPTSDSLLLYVRKLAWHHMDDWLHKDNLLGIVMLKLFSCMHKWWKKFRILHIVTITIIWLSNLLHQLKSTVYLKCIFGIPCILIDLSESKIQYTVDFN